MPHLMNCEHADEGWCLGCVRELWDEKELAQTHVAALKKDIEDLIYLDGEADERALANLWQKGREAWRDVTSAAGWVESLRGNK